MKYLIRTYGCQMNVRDSEAVGALLDAANSEGTTQRGQSLF